MEKMIHWGRAKGFKLSAESKAKLSNSMKQAWKRYFEKKEALEHQTKFKKAKKAIQ